MKKVFVTMFAIVSLTTISNAQDVKQEDPKKMEAAPMQPKLTKEQKEALLVEAFKKAELTNEEQTKARQILEESSAKNKEVKNSTTLTEDEKKVKFKENADAKNAKLKEAMGEAKYKAYQAAVKEQKQAAKN